MKENKIRPYWHVDLKWIFGILATISLTASMTSFVLWQLMSEKVAIPVATIIVASQFSRKGLDDPTEIEQAKKIFLKSSQDVYYPMGKNSDVKITRSDLETLSPRDIRLKIFRQVVEPYYYGEIIDEKIKQQAGILAYLNKKTGETLSRIFLISLIPLFPFFTGLIFFSYRYGRLVSPAVVLLLVGLIPSLLLSLINLTGISQQQFGSDKPTATNIPFEVLKLISSAISTGYYTIVLLGTLLLLSALIIKLYFGYCKNHKSHHEKTN